MAFSWRCAGYGDMVTACGGIAVSELVLSHVKGSQALRDRTEQLRSEAPAAPPAMHDAAREDAAVSTGTHKYSSGRVYTESLSLLRKLDSRLRTLLDTIASWVAVLEEVDATSSGLTLAQLGKMRRMWSERKESLDRALEALNGDQTGNAAHTHDGGLPVFLRSMARSICNFVIR
ncbi:hypothetical protein BC834DRAFT_897445 [Gloeopeniophorella convolvens]|nr:hypothetical protein BC834DRAFT_897445 [Gloeopeniophorella convolvens]